MDLNYTLKFLFCTGTVVLYTYSAWYLYHNMVNGTDTFQPDINEPMDWLWFTNHIAKRASEAASSLPQDAFYF